MGVHRGTVMSRDIHQVATKWNTDEPLISLEDCKEAAKKWKKNYIELGCQIWFMQAWSPDGEMTSL